MKKTFNLKIEVKVSLGNKAKEKLEQGKKVIISDYGVAYNEEAITTIKLKKGVYKVKYDTEKMTFKTIEEVETFLKDVYGTNPIY